MDAGIGVFLLSELQLAEKKAGDTGGSTAPKGWYKPGDSTRMLEEGREYTFRLKSQVHSARSLGYGHRVVENKLIAALKAENANHPLASREAVDLMVTNERLKALSNIKVIKQTYPDGVVPDGVMDPDGSVVYAI